MDTRTDRTRAAALVAVTLTALPIAVAGVRAAVGRWVPPGDEAYFTVRSLDVGTEHHPLLGAWSSGSADVDRSVNNLGPIQLDALAPFTNVAPMGGTAIGVVVLHVIAVVTIAWLVRRIGGWNSVAPAMVAVALLAWVMGSEMLITPRQHQFLLLPYLVVLVAAWAATAGDRWAIVPFVVAGSLVVQTHLSYPILVAVLAFPVLAGQALAFRRTAGVGHGRPWVVAGVAGAALWSQTVVDQFWGQGNLGDVLSSPGETETPPLSDGLRIVADVIVHARGYLRPGFADYAPDVALADTAQVVVLLALVAVLVAGGVLAGRSGRRVSAAGLTVAAVAIVAAVVDATQLPITQFDLTAGNYRWLWPTASFLVLGALAAGASLLRRRHGLVVGLLSVGGVAVLCLLNLPTSYQVPDPEGYERQLASTAALTSALASADLAGVDGPIVIDHSRMYFGHPYTYPVATVLRERGLDYRLPGDGQARRFGDKRVSDGTEPYRLVLVHGDAAVAVEGDPDVVAYTDDPLPVALILEPAP